MTLSANAEMTKTDEYRIFTGENTVMPWENIIDLVQIQCSFYPGVCALSSDGSVYSALGMYYEEQASIEDCGQVKPELFEDIVEIDTSYDLLVGLKSDGTVVATNLIFDGYYSFEDDPISAWSGIVDIAVNGEKAIYGLKQDGTVVTNSTNETILESIANWKDIVALYSGENHVVALRSDGKLLTVGKNEYGQCDIGDWNLNPMSGDANDISF